MDRIFIRNLQIETVIGIYDWERTRRQRVILDIEMSADVARAAQTEDIADTLDYKALSDDLVQMIQGSRFLLVEALAETTVRHIRENYAVQWVRLTLHKPDALDGDTDVGVIIERGERAHD